MMNDYTIGYNLLEDDLKEFHQFMELGIERSLWSGNYNNATRDEFVAGRAWLFQGKKIKELQAQLEKAENVIKKIADINRQALNESKNNYSDLFEIEDGITKDYYGYKN